MKSEKKTTTKWIFENEINLVDQGSNERIKQTTIKYYVAIV